MIPRLLEARVMGALRDRPVVLITGPRQSGKTTLARSIPGYAYVTLDSLAALDAARSDPEGFVAGLPDRTVIDEVQRAPGLFLSPPTSTQSPSPRSGARNSALRCSQRGARRLWRLRQGLMNPSAGACLASRASR